MAKTCTKCNNVYSGDMFYKHKGRKDGYDDMCKTCKKQQANAYRIANPEKVKARKKADYENNKEKYLSKSKTYQESHSEQVKVYRDEYYHKNKDTIIAKVNKWQKDNLERARETKRRSADKLRKQRIARIKERYHNDEGFRLRHNARMKKYTSTENGNLKQLEKVERRRSKIASLDFSFTSEDWLNCVKHFDGRCAYCGKEKPLARDHFIPLSHNGEYTINNIIPSCKSCNSRKHNLGFFDWYPNQSFYSKQRETKILKYLNYNSTTQTQQLALY